MKKNILIIAIAAVSVCLSFTSCKTVSYEARNIDIQNTDVISTPTVVDIKVDLTKRVNYADQFYVKYKQATSTKQLEECALQAARYNCIMQNNIDIVVDPVYKISIKGGNKAKIEMTGYAGYYQNPRSAIQDVKSFENIDMETVKKYIYFNYPLLLNKDNAGSVNITFPENK